MSWKTERAAIESFDNQRLENFNQNGDDVHARFMAAGKTERTAMLTLAEAYKLGTYETPEGQVADAWSEHMSTVDSIEMDKIEAFLRETSHAGKKIQWLKNNVETGAYGRVADMLADGDFERAMDELINLRGNQNEILGSNPAKTAMSALLLGFDEAFVMDRNVANVTARYLQYAFNAQSSGFTDAFDLPTCSACWTSYMEERNDNHGEYFGKVDDYGVSALDMHPWEKSTEKWAYFHDLEYFREFHLKREHIKNYGDWAQYADILRSKVAELAGFEPSNRELTQILFNVGMVEGDKSMDDASKTYMHDAFYKTMTS